MLYTKQGDDGMSRLRVNRLSKSDPVFAFLGDMDELNSYIGLIKTKLTPICDDGALLEAVQANLSRISAIAYDPSKASPVPPESAVNELESKIDYYQSICATKGFVKPGGCELSALIDVCRCVARRAERSLSAVRSVMRPEALKYINRLSDYLFAFARYADFIDGIEDGVRRMIASAKSNPAAINTDTLTVGVPVVPEQPISTDACRYVSAALEVRARAMGINAAVAFCDKNGGTVLACAMDGALLVSFDCAVRKAYTAVALRMTTARAQELIQPGEMFFGLSDDRLLMIPGGMPIIFGDTVIGGIGVSGGDAKADTELAEYGAALFSRSTL